MSIAVFGATERKQERHVECSGVGDRRGPMFSLCYRQTHNKAKQKRTLWGPVMTCVTLQFWPPLVHSEEKLEFSNFSSVQFSLSVMSYSLKPHGLQHTRLPCPSATPRACSNSCPSSWLCHPNISFSVFPFSSCIQSFPASGSFQWISSSYQVAKVLEFQLQHQSFQWIFRTDFL